MTFSLSRRAFLSASNSRAAAAASRLLGAGEGATGVGGDEATALVRTSRPEGGVPTRIDTGDATVRFVRRTPEPAVPKEDELKDTSILAICQSVNNKNRIRTGNITFNTTINTI
jgi:hypothetical protein